MARPTRRFAAKLTAARRAGLTPILCVGETRAEREGGRADEIVARQIEGSIPDDAPRGELIVAYEPIWAIGTGLTPTADDIVAMHTAIRARLTPVTPILYGGSVNPRNAAAILSLDGVDGALVGGASLNAEDFWAIARACG